jgi:hypothetical protein
MSCGRHKERIKKREELLNVREQHLQSWEQQLRLKEKRLIALEWALDSARRQLDSVGIYDSSLVGNWHVTMRCTETSCDGSAIGDTKTEQWNITYRNNRIIARVTSNKKFSRIYQGLYRENNLQLINRQQQQNTETVIMINLHPISKDKMEGERVIDLGGNCKIIYDIEIEKL